ncbi:DUF2007 domain-containing protein [Candidatus Bipolaricaulota bacterium]|nr:DUF2007 domain-containing protein [Candidatus Bipolaricaulota bacterium]
MAEHGRMVIVASFGRPVDAHLARMELEAEGIQAFILDEHAISANPFYAPALGGVKVAVREEDAARARAILGKEPG